MGQFFTLIFGLNHGLGQLDIRWLSDLNASQFFCRHSHRDVMRPGIREVNMGGIEEVLRPGDGEDVLTVGEPAKDSTQEVHGPADIFFVNALYFWFFWYSNLSLLVAPSSPASSAPPRRRTQCSGSPTVTHGLVSTPHAPSRSTPTSASRRVVRAPPIMCCPGIAVPPGTAHTPLIMNDAQPCPLIALQP